MDVAAWIFKNTCRKAEMYVHRAITDKKTKNTEKQKAWYFLSFQTDRIRPKQMTKKGVEENCSCHNYSLSSPVTKTYESYNIHFL